MSRARPKMAWVQLGLSLVRFYLLNSFVFLGGMTTFWVLITGVAVIEPHQIYLSLVFGLLAITGPWRNLMRPHPPHRHEPSEAP
jgi:hypothetical protein